MAVRRYRLADPGQKLPMPDRPGRLFSASPEGEAVDPENRFWATLIADGALVPVDSPTAAPAAAPRAEGEPRRKR